jgi:anti-anti-sigma factor
VNPFRYDVRRLQDLPVAVVTLQGNIDSPASHRLNEALGHVLESDVTHVVVDMVRVGYVNSEGWRVLLLRARELEQGQGQGEMRLADLSADLDTVFRMLGLSEVIHTHANLEDALQASVASFEDSSSG